jgi:hypothetical protein
MRKKALNWVRIGVGAVIAVSALGIGAVAPALAHADSVQPSDYHAPAGVGMGGVSVSTAPGGTIIVDITGRSDAIGTSGPTGGGCLVVLGGHYKEQFVPLPGGSGRATFSGLEPGNYGVSGICGSHNLNGKSELINATPMCDGCSSIAVLVTLDGNGTVGPRAATPLPSNNAVPQSLESFCNDLQTSINAVGLAGFLVGPAAGTLIEGATLITSGVVHGMCLAAAGSLGVPATLKQGCYTVEDFARETAVDVIESKLHVSGPILDTIKMALPSICAAIPA